MELRTGLSKLFWKYLTYFATVIFGLTITTIFFQVLFRYFIKVSVPWTEELSRYLYIWSIFIGSAVASKEKLHMDLEFIEFKKPFIALTAVILRHASILFFSVVVLIGALEMVQNNFGVLASTIPISYSYVYLSLLIGFILILYLEIKDIGIKLIYRK
jgi:TRAP-type C4-dicarboxylate transport system permease small subunit